MLKQVSDIHQLQCCMKAIFFYALILFNKKFFENDSKVSFSSEICRENGNTN